MDRVIALACVDPKRVYATGLSNGGGFAARAGCELADRFAAVVPVAGGYRALERCPAGRRTSLLEIHGTGDTVVPYRGRGPRREGDVRRFVAQWARRDGCSPRPQITRPSAGVQRVRYRGCAPGLAVEHLRIEDEPHGWPADTSEIVWRFFEGRRQPER
jgi:polyhydroxybutyrate depolymerase